MEIKIATFNIQNKYRIRNYDGKDQYGDNVEKLVNFITKNKIDILGVQESVKPYLLRLKRSLEQINYFITGKYRLKGISNIFPFLRKYNETNSIITKHEILKSQTKSLPSLPHVPRIATIAQIKIDNTKINIINTHLDYLSLSIRKKQLKKLLKFIKKTLGEVILMGDFNLSTNNELFQHFIEDMKKINLIHIDVNARTHIHTENAIDHIFISKSLGIINNIEVYTKLGKMSDHYPIIISLCTNI